MATCHFEKVLCLKLDGVGNKRHGEDAVTESSPGPRDADRAHIRAFCKGKIAACKVPRYIRFEAGFSMPVTGKIQKFWIRDEMKSQLGLEEDLTDQIA
jgi:fatty-acyl-CoA synthase